MNFKFVNVDGINTRYVEAGKGKPLVLIHGGQYGDFAYSAYSWSLNIPSLAENFHVYAFDKLGMGHTDNPRRDQDYTMTATLLHAQRVLEALKVKAATVVGHSRGALVAARLAIENPALVDSLVVVDSNTLAPDDPITPKNFYYGFRKSPPASKTKEEVIQEPVANSYSSNHITNDFVDALYEISKLPKIGHAWERMKALDRTIFIPDLQKRRRETIELIESGKLKVPTLTVWGFNDPSAPINLAYNLHKIINSHQTRSQLHVFNHAGHYCFREHYREFNTVVKAFLQP